MLLQARDKDLAQVLPYSTQLAGGWLEGEARIDEILPDTAVFGQLERRTRIIALNPVPSRNQSTSESLGLQTSKLSRVDFLGVAEG
jgi:hypothetical protein